MIARLIRYFERYGGGASCNVCGCTEHAACPGGCYWVEPGLCSTCADDLAENADVLV